MQTNDAASNFPKYCLNPSKLKAPHLAASGVSDKNSAVSNAAVSAPLKFAASIVLAAVAL